MPYLEPNRLHENNFFPLLLSKNSMRERKQVLALCPTEIHLSTENIALMSLPVIFTLKMSNKDMQGSRSLTRSLSLINSSSSFVKNGSKLEGSQLPPPTLGALQRIPYICTTTAPCVMHSSLMQLCLRTWHGLLALHICRIWPNWLR